MSENKTTNNSHELDKVMLLVKNAKEPIDVRQAEKNLQAFKQKLIDSKDKKTLMRLYNFLNKRGLIKDASPDYYAYTELQAKECKYEAQCYRKMPSSAFREEVGNFYPYSKYFDESKRVTVYVFYIDKLITGDEQITPELARKMERGFAPKEEDFADDVRRYVKFSLREEEFLKYFKTDPADNGLDEAI